MKMKRKGLFDYVNIILMLVIGFITVYPFYLVLIISLNEPFDASTGGIYLFPRIFSIVNYQYVFSSRELIWSFLITILRTVIGTLTSVFFTAAFSYGISKRNLIGRKTIIILMTITLYFSGGLIPQYLLYKYLGLIGNFLVLIIPCMFSFYNAILIMSFMKTIPSDIEESAKLDGANDMLIFVKIIIPVSAPVLATIALFNGVFHWNSWFDAMLFGGKKLQTVQGFLAQIIQSAQLDLNDLNATSSIRKQIKDQLSQPTGESIKLATMVITTLPIVFIYPFLQKYFVKGIMIGSLKG